MNKPKVQLVITLDEDGQVGIRGPLQDPVLCYGLIEAAKDALQDHNRAGPKIQPGSLDDLKGLEGGNGGLS